MTSYPTEITGGAAAQEQLRTIAHDLGDIRERLRTIVASLSAGRTEPPEDEEDDDVRSDRETEVRSVAECVLADNIAPAIEALLRLQRPRVPGEPSE